MNFPEFDISTTMSPTTAPSKEDIPRKGLSGVEIGVITVAVAIALVTFCMLVSVVRSSS